MTGLQRGDLDDELRLDLDQRCLAALAPIGSDLVRPRMARTSGLQQPADRRGLVVCQLYGPADHLENLTAVPPDDQNLGRPEPAGDRADDRFDGVTGLPLHPPPATGLVSAV